LSQEFPVEIDVSQVEGALLNLVLNAIDALEEGGTITLSATQEENLLRVDVQNSGPQIPASVLDRIFEPFFTTKPAGTGLGLAIARGAARAHGGDLSLRNNQDGCVTFSMTLKDSTIQ
jgi:signal transduction histidine kinase